MPCRSLAVLSLVILYLVAGCTPRPTATPTAEPTPTVLPPSPVPRVLPTATPGPLSAVPADKLPGVVMPASAKLVSFAVADETATAQAEYFIADMSVADARAWFSRHMPEAGWRTPEELDGSLLFSHERELSAQRAREGYSRSALFLFEAEADGVTVIVNAEAGN